MSAKNMMINGFLSDLAVMNVKIHNLHWNVVGMEFRAVHKMTEKIYELMADQFDEVAEVMKMKNLIPFARMADYLDNSVISEIESRPYQTDEVIAILEKDWKALIERAKKLREEAAKKDDFLVANLMDDYLRIYAKKAWMISAMLEDEPKDFEE